MMVQTFNSILQEGKIPEEWCNSIIKLIHKSGSPQDIANFRPISLSNTLPKILFKILQNRLKKLLNKSQLISTLQNGFVETFSTHHNVSMLLNIIEDSKNNGKQLFTCYIDIKKAYDSVQHWALEQTLLNYNFDKKFIEFIKDIYKKSTIQIEVNNILTEKIPLLSGIRQGCPLSCLLFIIHINPIIQKIQKKYKGAIIENTSVPIIAFVDDIIILSHNLEEFQAIIKDIFECLKTIQFQPSFPTNPSDTTKTAFTTLIETNITLQTEVNEKIINIPYIVPSEFYRFLGFHLSFNGDTSKIEQKELGKVWKMNAFLKRKAFTAIQCVEIINKTIIPSIIYRSQLISLPDSFYKLVDNLHSSLIYRKMNKHGRNAFWRLENPTKNGGLGLLNSKIYSVASQISTTLRLLVTSHEKLLDVTVNPAKTKEIQWNYTPTN